MLCALIMAGGKGERFWPLSTDEKPKQFINLIGNDSMLQMTVKRMEKIIPLDRIFVVTDRRYKNIVIEQLPCLHSNNIIIEPIGRNTSACIALSSFIIDKYYEDATLITIPSDHLIEKEDIFFQVVNAGYQFIEYKKEAVITIGIKPDRPEVGFGYIKYGAAHTNINSNKIYCVDKFVEKPNLETATEYLESGNYLWNSGIFIWNVKTIKELFKSFLPNTYEIIKEIYMSLNMKDYEVKLESLYGNIDNISVDYAIMEKSDDIYVIPSEFGWDDVGTWLSYRRYNNKDNHNNILKGNIKIEDCSDIVAISETSKKEILLLGLQSLFIIEIEDKLIIATDKYINDLKKIKLQLDNYNQNVNKP